MSNVKANLELVDCQLNYCIDDVGRMVRECYAAWSRWPGR